MYFLLLLKKIWNNSPRHNFGILFGKLRFVTSHSLLNFPRYTLSDVSFLGHTIKIVDSASFASMKRELFDHEIYKFIADKKDPYIVDCGANIGLSIIYFKRLYPDAKIIAFEPDKNIFNVLRDNITIFGFSDVTLLDKGVWNKEGVLQFYAEGADGGRIATNDDTSNLIKIKTTRLREYLQHPVDFLKIDIEGAETEVLGDCCDLLDHVKNIFVEYHSFNKKQQTLDRILKILTDAGFRYYIQSLGVVSRSPLWKRESSGGIDMQLNIFAYKNYDQAAS